jgi:hypothetical protein
MGGGASRVGGRAGRGGGERVGNGGQVTFRAAMQLFGPGGAI